MFITISKCSLFLTQRHIVCIYKQYNLLSLGVNSFLWGFLNLFFQSNKYIGLTISSDLGTTPRRKNALNKCASLQVANKNKLINIGTQLIIKLLIYKSLIIN